MAQVIAEDTRIIPGHGAVATREDLIEYGAMLRTIRDRIQDGIDAGHSLGEILGSVPTAGFGPGDPEEFVTNTYDTLAP